MTDERIAVVGLAARVPGAEDVDQLWRHLMAGVDGVRRYTPADLIAAGAPDDPDWVPAFGHLDGLTDVDAGLFGLTDDEADRLDPQHRLFLEVAWHALEDAGIDPDRGEAQIGVFAGCGPDRYLRHHLLGNPALTPPAGRTAEDWDDLLAGGGCDYLPTRTAYLLGLTGPAVAVQTACSTSLVAVTMAAQSLLDFRCDVAIAGGAAVVSTRQAGYRYRPGGTLAVDGVCRPYDRAATGQVFGNGAAAVVLKRLGDAIADEDPVYALLAGWAVNNDGSQRAGFTVPGVVGQSAVVAEALAAAGWDAADLGYIEGHGSGTLIGDLIEVEALGRLRRRAGRPGLLGSVKANLGNLDAAAGVVGLIKAVYAVATGQVPGTLHFTAPHADAKPDTGPAEQDAVAFEVSAEARDLPAPRRAGVSSFGLGGTNAHVLVEPCPVARASTVEDWTVLPLSAADPAALRELAGRLSTMDVQDGQSVVDIAHTLAVGRRRLAVRGAVIARDLAGARAGLAALAAGGGASDPVDAPEPLRRQAADWRAGRDIPVGPGRRIRLPGYPFQRRRHWIEAIR